MKKKKRIACPECAELILPSAKKCRFCGFELKKDKVNNSLNKPFIYWMVSVAIFFAVLFLFRIFSDSEALTPLLMIFTVSVLAGIISFILLMIRISRTITSKNSQKYLLISSVIFFSFFIILFNFNSIASAFGFPLPNDNKTVNKVASTPSPTPSPTKLPTTTPTPKSAQTTYTAPISDQIDCLGPDGVVFKTTQEECDEFNSAWGNEPTPDPNEYIKCNIHPNCGGGYKEMTRSSCESITCCQINDTWELREDGQCNAEQDQQSEEEWIEFCNGLYDPDDCSTYWEAGTSFWYDCRADAYDGRLDCYENK